MGMEIKKNLNQLLGKPMNRQDFIKHIAIGAVAVVGGGALLRIGMSGSGSGRVSQQSGYGGSAYGGVKQGGDQPTRRTA
ncbi:uncharacterized protein PO2_contig-046-9 [Mycobacterium sp. PO2]|nr:uncharacterized protein PO2_contig-046-9 [Mycobacterium sp. PO2]